MAERISLEGLARRFLKALNRTGLRYTVMGGIAAIYYGRPRTTLDVDVAVELKEQDLERLYKIMKGAGFEMDLDGAKRALREKGHFNLFLPGSLFRVDVSGIYGSLERAGLKKKRRARLYGVPAWVQAPEDVIVAKLVYASPQDIEDARAILLRQISLDRTYLRNRAREEGVLRGLERLLKKLGRK